MSYQDAWRIITKEYNMNVDRFGSEFELLDWEETETVEIEIEFDPSGGEGDDNDDGN